MVSWTRLWTFLATLMGVPSPCNSHAPLDSDHWKQNFRRRWWGSSLSNLPLFPSLETVMCKFYQHAPFRPWLRKSQTLFRMEDGAKLGPKNNQILPKSNSHLKSPNQASRQWTQIQNTQQAKNNIKFSNSYKWKIHLKSTHISENLLQMVQKFLRQCVHTIKLECNLVFHSDLF